MYLMTRTLFCNILLYFSILKNVINNIDELDFYSYIFINGGMQISTAYYKFLC